MGYHRSHGWTWFLGTGGNAQRKFTLQSRLRLDMCAIWKLGFFICYCVRLHHFRSVIVSSSSTSFFFPRDAKHNLGTLSRVLKIDKYQQHILSLVNVYTVWLDMSFTPNTAIMVMARFRRIIVVFLQETASWRWWSSSFGKKSSF